jgi:hypothetical protein
MQWSYRDTVAMWEVRVLWLARMLILQQVARQMVD